jgi:hypothetical protein
MDRHAAEPLTPELRKKQVSRLVEVVARKQLQQETLFLAATYLDRFLSITQVGTVRASQVFGGSVFAMSLTPCPLPPSGRADDHAASHRDRVLVNCQQTGGGEGFGLIHTRGLRSYFPGNQSHSVPGICFAGRAAQRGKMGSGGSGVLSGL